MAKNSDRISDLTTLNRIIETLNQAVDVRQVLQSALSDLVKLMGLETGWIFLVDEQAQDSWAGKGFKLVAHINLPPALAVNNPEAWNKGCDCQGFCKSGTLNKAYNEVRCSRLSESQDDRGGLAVHASIPLRAGEQVLGILNIASPDWDVFTPRALALLTNIGNQMGNSLERARLFDMLRVQRIQEQAALLELSNQLLSRLDMDDIMAYLVEVVPDLLKADACALLLPAEDPEFLEFRAAKGWSMDPVALKRQIPFDERSGPGTVMMTQELLVAENIELRDPAPWAPDWVLAEGFRGHAVIPLIAEGDSVGVMTINTRRPYTWDHDDIRFMRLIVNQIALAIETARLHQEQLARQRLEQELAVGRKIQLSLLPQSPPQVAGWDFTATYRSARQVSGDFYDFYSLPKGRLGIIIADVVDKGVPAALFMALSRTVIRTMALSGKGPAATLRKANELILKDSRASLFLTAFYASLDPQDGCLRYANAGHHRPLWLQAKTGRCQELAAKGSLLAVLDHLELEEKEVQLEEGDMVIFYTDGLTDAMNPKGEIFGEDRLREIVEKNAGVNAEKMLDDLLNAISEYSKGTPLIDDLTLIIVHRILKE
jgi:sigma-B regulation protein RsbU (phosphoserine phosphatase)